jgi:acyl-CoA synthetase (AMP-forming)/AMP-acid ligase II
MDFLRGVPRDGGALRPCADRARACPGDRLAAQVEKSPEALALYAGCVQAGAIFLPLNTAYTVASSLFHREQRRAHGRLRSREATRR